MSFVIFILAMLAWMIINVADEASYNENGFTEEEIYAMQQEICEKSKKNTIKF